MEIYWFFFLKNKTEGARLEDYFLPLLRHYYVFWHLSSLAPSTTRFFSSLFSPKFLSRSNEHYLERQSKKEKKKEEKSGKISLVLFFFFNGSIIFPPFLSYPGTGNHKSEASRVEAIYCILFRYFSSCHQIDTTQKLAKRGWETYLMIGTEKKAICGNQINGVKAEAHKKKEEERGQAGSRHN